MEIRNRPQRQDELIVRNRMGMTFETVSQRQSAVRKVDMLHFPGKQLHLAQQFSHGIDDRGQLQIARGNFVQHGRKQKEIVPVHKSNIDVGFPAQSPFQFQRAIKTAKPPA